MTRALLAVVLIMVVLGAGCADTNEEVVLAVVNGERITEEQLMLHLNLARLHAPEQEFSLVEQQQVLESIIQLQMLYQEALRRGLKPDKAKATDDYFYFRDQAIRLYFAGDSAAYHHRLQLLDIDEGKLIDLIEKYQLANVLIQRQVDQAWEPSSESVRQFYQQNRERYFAHGERRKVRHILINQDSVAAEEDPESAALDLAWDIYQKLIDGNDFSRLAAEYSQDSNAQSGGLLGYIEKEDVLYEFGHVAFSLPINQPSEPVRTVYGFHIIEVLEIQAPGYLPLDEALSGEIASYLYQQQRQQLREQLLEELYSQAKIDRKF